MFRLFLFQLFFLSGFCRAQDTASASHTSCVPQFDSTLNRSYYTYVDEMPSYAGGEDSLRKIWQKNIKYPHTHGCGGGGTVYISMIIEADGSVSSVVVKKGFHPLYDQEALRVAKLLTAWSPGKCNGVAVPVQRFIPVRFVLQ
jgi:periplasmic protein TonB